MPEDEIPHLKARIEWLELVMRDAAVLLLPDTPAGVVHPESVLQARRLLVAETGPIAF